MTLNEYVLVRLDHIEVNPLGGVKMSVAAHAFVAREEHHFHLRSRGRVAVGDACQQAGCFWRAYMVVLPEPA